MLETLICRRCGQARTVKANRNKSGLCSPCYQANKSENALPLEEAKLRARLRGRQHYAANREKLQAKGRADYHNNTAARIASAQAWKAANPERKRVHTRRFNLSKYGVSLEEYEILLVGEAGVCAICKAPPANGRCLDVDHSTDRKTVRGLLCNACNRGLSAFRDDVKRLQTAIYYLEARQ